MKVGLLTPEQKELIEGKEFATDSFFNPIQDKNGNWIISLEEIYRNDFEEFEWLKEIPFIEFEPKTVNSI